MKLLNGSLEFPTKVNTTVPHILSSKEWLTLAYNLFTPHISEKLNGYLVGGLEQIWQIQVKFINIYLYI